jgi:hypothetical protein
VPQKYASFFKIHLQFGKNTLKKYRVLERKQKKFKGWVRKTIKKLKNRRCFFRTAGLKGVFFMKYVFFARYALKKKAILRFAYRK